MEIKCEYCGSIIKETDEKCPYCGATNQAVKRSADNTPKTIAQLKQWYEKRGLPPYEVTRFFIGINYTKPRAFGIYQEGNEFIVYKNKADGQRAIRYRGTDEAYAVNELYLKIKSEILNQKEHNQNLRENGRRNISAQNRKGFPLWLVVLLSPLIGIGLVFLIVLGVLLNDVYAGLPFTFFLSFVVGIFAAVLSGVLIANCSRRVPILGRYSQWLDKGSSRLLCHYFLCVLLCFAILISPIHNYQKVSYYRYHDTVYVNSHYDWFEYDGYDYDEVSQNDLPDDFINDKTEYSIDRNNGWDSSITRFEDSGYYEDHYAGSSSDSDYDSDYDWDSGDSWDSDSGDWDSDW